MGCYAMRQRLHGVFLHGVWCFQDLQDSREGFAPNTLSARLKRLQEQGVLERHFYSDRPPRAEYRLTAKGQSLGPVLLALREWGEQQC